MLLLSHCIFINNAHLGCETTCNQICLQLSCQNAAWKEKSKLCGMGQGRASWGWMPERQSNTGNNQKDAVWGDTLPHNSYAGATLFHSQ